MTSKEAINKLKHCGVEEIRLAMEEIEKDLEMLEKHHQIEEELGIDLVTLFKALKQGGVYVKARSKSDWEIPMSGFQICGDKLNGISFWSQVRLNAEDYGETWALTKEELER